MVKRKMKKHICLFLLFGLLALVGFAQTNTWTGSTDNDWHKPCNWSLNQIPQCSHDVVVPVTANNPHITALAHCRTLEVQYTNGAQVYLETSNGGVLIISTANNGGCSATPVEHAGCCASGGGSALLSYTGGEQSWTVPACVTSVSYNCVGASGGWGYPAYSRGGYGGQITGTLAVTPGETLYFYVGGAGGNAGSCNGGGGGFNGGATGAVYCGSYGGGCCGGASDIRRGGNGTGNRVAVAGGGGGGGLKIFYAAYDRGGNGGGATGEQGHCGNGYSDGNGVGGDGGSQGGGGAAGIG